LTAAPTPPGYVPAPLGPAVAVSRDDTASVLWIRRIIDVVNRTLQGKLNATLPVTLSAGMTTTTITDARISAFSYIDFMPLTASAAAMLAGGMFVSSQQSGEATVTHLNSASTDLDFRALIIS
jgi:hypothetical protein